MYTGDRMFSADVLYGMGDVLRSLAIGDLDGNLNLDLAVANLFSNDISRLVNDCGASAITVVSDTVDNHRVFG